MEGEGVSIPPMPPWRTTAVGAAVALPPTPTQQVYPATARPALNSYFQGGEPGVQRKVSVPVGLPAYCSQPATYAGPPCSWLPHAVPVVAVPPLGACSGTTSAPETPPQRFDSATSWAATPPTHPRLAGPVPAAAEVRWPACPTQSAASWQACDARPSSSCSSHGGSVGSAPPWYQHQQPLPSAHHPSLQHLAQHDPWLPLPPAPHGTMTPCWWPYAPLPLVAGMLPPYATPPTMPRPGHPMPPPPAPTMYHQPTQQPASSISIPHVMVGPLWTACLEGVQRAPCRCCGGLTAGAVHACAMAHAVPAPALPAAASRRAAPASQPDWTSLPLDLLALVFSQLPFVGTSPGQATAGSKRKGREASPIANARMVCRAWRQAHDAALGVLELKFYPLPRRRLWTAFPNVKTLLLGDLPGMPLSLLAAGQSTVISRGGKPWDKAALPALQPQGGEDGAAAAAAAPGTPLARAAGAPARALVTGEQGSGALAAGGSAGPGSLAARLRAAGLMADLRRLRSLSSLSIEVRVQASGSGLGLGSRPFASAGMQLDDGSDPVELEPLAGDATGGAAAGPWLVPMLAGAGAAAPAPSDASGQVLEQLLLVGGRAAALTGVSGMAALRCLTRLAFLGKSSTRCSLPPGLGDCPYLASLTLKSIGLSALPPDLRRLSRTLTSLDVSSNVLTSLEEATLRPLTGLRSLNAEFNQLAGPLPAWVSELADLRELLLGCNSITAVSEEAVSGLLQLEYLDLSENASIAELPCGVTRLTRLETLLLSGCLIERLPEGLSALVRLENLSLLQCEVPSLPAGLGAMSSLLWLNLGFNGLRTAALPASLSRLGALRHLEMAHNALVKLPAWVSHMTGLTHLDLSYNRLRSLPPGLGRCAGLQQLLADHNRLGGPHGGVPAELAELRALTRLSLSSNPLGAMPAALNGMTGLQVLQLCRCRLAGVLPEGCLAGARRLRVLLLSGNSGLRELPLSWERDLPALRRLAVLAVRLERVPRALAQKVQLAAGARGVAGPGDADVEGERAQGVTAIEDDVSERHVRLVWGQA